MPLRRRAPAARAFRGPHALCAVSASYCALTRRELARQPSSICDACRRSASCSAVCASASCCVEDVAVGDCLGEPDFDLTLALRSVHGGQLFGRGALFGVLQRRRGVGEPAFERLPGRGRLGERRGELRFASYESVGRGRRARRPGLLGLVECPFGVASPAARGCRAWFFLGRSRPEGGFCPREGALPRC